MWSFRVEIAVGDTIKYRDRAREIKKKHISIHSYES